MRKIAPENPAATTNIQNSLICLLVFEIHDNPCIVEVLRNSFKSSMMLNAHAQGENNNTITTVF